MSSHFASGQRKNLSTAVIRTERAHGKSLFWKEFTYKEYEQNRYFGLEGVSIPTLESRVLVNTDETLQENYSENVVLKNLVFSTTKSCPFK
jgi:hypothetical protein